jgi:hypothetical protein
MTFSVRTTNLETTLELPFDPIQSDVQTRAMWTGRCPPDSRHFGHEGRYQDGVVPTPFMLKFGSDGKQRRPAVDLPVVGPFPRPAGQSQVRTSKR